MKLLRGLCTALVLVAGTDSAESGTPACEIIRTSEAVALARSTAEEIRAGSTMAETDSYWELRKLLRSHVATRETGSSVLEIYLTYSQVNTTDYGRTEMHFNPIALVGTGKLITSTAAHPDSAAKKDRAAHSTVVKLSWPPTDTLQTEASVRDTTLLECIIFNPKARIE